MNAIDSTAPPWYAGGHAKIFRDRLKFVLQAADIKSIRNGLLRLGAARWSKP